MFSRELGNNAAHSEQGGCLSYGPRLPSKKQCTYPSGPGGAPQRLLARCVKSQRLSQSAIDASLFLIARKLCTNRSFHSDDAHHTACLPTSKAEPRQALLKHS